MATRDRKRIVLHQTNGVPSFSEGVRNYAYQIGMCPDCFREDDFRSDLVTVEIDGEKRKQCSRCKGVVYVEEG